MQKGGGGSAMPPITGGGGRGGDDSIRRREEEESKLAVHQFHARLQIARHSFGLSLDFVTLNDASKAEASSPLPRRGRVARPPPRPSPRIGDLRHRPIPLPPQEHPPQEALRSPAREGTRLLQEGVSDFVHPCELHPAMDDIF